MERDAAVEQIIRDSWSDYEDQRNPGRFLAARKWIGRTCLASLAIIGTVVPIQNLGEIARWQELTDQGSLIPSPPGCPKYDVPDDETAEEQAIRLGVDDVSSAAKKNHQVGINPFRVFEQVTSFFDHPQGAFVSQHSGIKFSFYSDEPNAEWSLNHQNFDDVFHLGLTEEIDHQNPKIDNVVSCFRDRIINDKEFSGEEYKIFIPSNPKNCLGNGEIIDFSQERSPEECKQKGFTPPVLRLNLLLGSIDETIMVLTGGKQADYDNIEENIAHILLHESIHAYLTLTDTPLRLDPDERWVQFQENSISDHIGEIPPVIIYPNKRDPPSILSIVK